ncbi:MAG: CopD family protein [Pseudomonadota bacterium]
MNAFAHMMHTLAAVVWVGGMFFAYVALRPSAAQVLEPPQRLKLWAQVFARFFTWVWSAIVLLPVTGFWMVFNNFQDFGQLGLHVHAMTLIGVVMILIFLYVYFVPYLQLRLAVIGEEWPKAGKQLTRIRWAVLINLLLGLGVVAIGSGGQYW